MGMVAPSVRDQLSEVAAMCPAVRSARTMAARRRNAELLDEREEDRARRKRRRQLIREDRELQRRWRRRVRVPLDERPQLFDRTARKLYARAEALLGGTIGISDARGKDGLYSLYFGWRSRGLDGSGRAWRRGEAARFARYILRETALEDGELGWFSNIGEDRAEIVSFFRTLEEIEKTDRSNANVYISIIIPLPHQLDSRGRRSIAKLITDAFARRGLPFVAALHLPDADGDQRNYHLHIQLSRRPFERHEAYDWTFSAAKETQFRHGPGISMLKRHTVRQINRVLAEAGIERRYTHLTRAQRGEGAGEMKRARGSKREERIEALGNIKEALEILREKVIAVKRHLARATGRRQAVAGFHVRVRAGVLSRAAEKVVSHRVKVSAIREGAMWLRVKAVLAATDRRLSVKKSALRRYGDSLIAFRHANSAHIRNTMVGQELASIGAPLEGRRGGTAALRSRLMLCAKRNALVPIERKITGARPRLDAYRASCRGWQSRIAARAKAASRLLEAREFVDAASERLRLHSHLLGHRLAAASASRSKAVLLARLSAIRGAEARTEQHREAVRRARTVLQRLHLWDTNRADPVRIQAARNSAEALTKEKFLPLQRIGGSLRIDPNHALAPEMFADIHERDAVIQALYRDKWKAMLRALDAKLRDSRDPPFVRTPAGLEVKPDLLEPDLAEAYALAKSDQEVIRLVQVAYERRRQDEQERQDRARKRWAKREAADKLRAANLARLLALIDRPPRPGTFSAAERRAIRPDVGLIVDALAKGELAIEKQDGGLRFLSNDRSFSSVTDRLSQSAAGREALSALAIAVEGHQPFVWSLSVTWSTAINMDKSVPMSQRENQLRLLSSAEKEGSGR